VFQPTLTLYIENGIPVDASLSVDTRMHLQNLVLQQRSTADSAQEDGDLPVTNGYGQVDGSDAEPETVSYCSICFLEIILGFASTFVHCLCLS
jgi:hypothetical protein